MMQWMGNPGPAELVKEGSRIGCAWAFLAGIAFVVCLVVL